MKTEQLKIHIEQLAKEIENSISVESKDHDYVCRLLDAKEYLRRAYHSIAGTPFEANDTQAETLHQMNTSTK